MADRRTAQDHVKEAATLAHFRRIVAVDGGDAALRAAVTLIGQLTRHVEALNLAHNYRLGPPAGRA